MRRGFFIVALIASLSLLALACGSSEDPGTGSRRRADGCANDRTDRDAGTDAGAYAGA